MKKYYLMLLSVVFIACAGGKKTAENTQNTTQKSTQTAPKTESAKKIETSDLPTGKWKLTSVVEGGNSVAIPNSSWNMNIEFSGTDRVAIQTPCNNGGCALQLSGISFKIHGCSLTEMFCAENARNEWQTKFVEYLQSVSSYSLTKTGSGNTLQLSGINITLHFTPTE
jgi:heat shock protein HslJ